MNEAIKAYTLEGAYASGEENIKGTITPGKLADFILLDRDLFNLKSEEEILDTRVVETYVGGQKSLQCIKGCHAEMHGIRFFVGGKTMKDYVVKVSENNTGVLAVLGHAGVGHVHSHSGFVQDDSAGFCSCCFHNERSF